MKGDFTRDTFQPAKNYLRVLMQQGRVQLDADWNEQVSILLNLVQNLARNVIGDHGGDGLSVTLRDAAGAVTTAKGQLDQVQIGRGTYYVQGRPCSNPYDLQLRRNSFPGGLDWENDSRHMFFLEVWERHLTYIEDEDIRERALNGPDTATRSQLTWRIHVAPTRKTSAELENYQTFLAEIGIGASPPLRSAQGTGTGELIAFTKADSAGGLGPCVVAPEARYRGPENQLYRVEIHTTGYDQKLAGQPNRPTATWKWSRDNGSTIFPIERIGTDSTSSTTTVTLQQMGRDERLTLRVNDYVEITGNDDALASNPGQLLRVREIRDSERKVILQGLAQGIAGTTQKGPRVLRRWDHRSTDPNQNAIPVVEGTDLPLEDGIWVRFEPAIAADIPRYYQSGDYWLIPARVATGEVEWPLADERRPKPLAARGIERFYAPLLYVTVNGQGAIEPRDLRKKLNTIGAKV